MTKQHRASPSADRILALQDQIRDGALTLADALKEIGAALAQPEPVAPTDEELMESAAKALGYVYIRVDSRELEADAGELLAFARAVLARWGTPANTINQED
jgi:hypothetical protein